MEIRSAESESAIDAIKSEKDELQQNLTAVTQEKAAKDGK